MYSETKLHKISCIVGKKNIIEIKVFTKLNFMTKVNCQHIYILCIIMVKKIKLKRYFCLKFTFFNGAKILIEKKKEKKNKIT